MSSISSHNEFSHRQGSITTLPDEEDQITAASDAFLIQQNRSSTNEYSIVPTQEDVQTASIDLQTVPDITNNESPTWEQQSKELSIDDQQYLTRSRSNSTDGIINRFNFQQQVTSIDNFAQETNVKSDYETFVRSQRLYYDPNPEYIRKPQMITPIVYTQNIMVKFLKPPSVPLGPLIIREVRPPQPPPPPPLVIRQRPPPPLSPPPLILREKPPRVPALLTTQVVTKTLPPVPPPPRSVIIEKLPPLPPKPRDIVIERWIPYESSTYKRKVIVQRAEEVKPHPPPRNIIITYDKVEAKIIRQFQRHAVVPEDPENYSARYGDSLLDTKDLLEKIKELGINEDISLPHVIAQELQEQSQLHSFEQNKLQNGNYSFDKVGGSYDDNYAATFENLIHGSSTSMQYDDWNDNSIAQENMGEDLSTQLAQYGLTPESIPF